MTVIQSKLGKWAKIISDKGLFFRVRSLVLYFFLYIANFDIWVVSLIKTRKKHESSKKFDVAIFSLYRPIFWHGNIVEMSVNIESSRRGCAPVHILCRGCLDVCDVHYYGSNKKNNPTICRDCHLRNRLFYSRNSASTIYIDDYLNSNLWGDEFANIDAITSIDEALGYHYKKLAFGKSAQLSVCRYYLRLTLRQEHLEVYKQFLRSAVKIYHAFDAMIKEQNFSNALIFNGRYITQNVPLSLFSSLKIPYSTYEFSDLQNVLFERNDISVLWHAVDRRFGLWLKTFPENNRSMKKEVSEFVAKRRRQYVSSFVDMKDNFAFGKIDLVVFTNIVWDSAAFDRDVAFSSQYDWIHSLICWAKDRPSIKMVVRIHPAETNVLYNKSMECMSDYINEKFPVLPKNIIVVPPNERKNSYAFLKKAKVVTVYSSSLGLEAALEGCCVISAAWSHYVMEGITLAPKTKDEYFKVLDYQLISGNQYEPDKELVEKYFYWYYLVYHRLTNTHLYKKPFYNFEDSHFIRVPKVECPMQDGELKEMVDDFLAEM